MLQSTVSPTLKVVLFAVRLTVVARFRQVPVSRVLCHPDKMLTEINLKNALVRGMSGKAWIGIRLKDHDELVRDSGGTESEEEALRPVAETRPSLAPKPFSTALGTVRRCRGTVLCATLKCPGEPVASSAVLYKSSD